MKQKHFAMMKNENEDAQNVKLGQTALLTIVLVTSAIDPGFWPELEQLLSRPVACTARDTIFMEAFSGTSYPVPQTWNAMSAAWLPNTELR